MLAGLGRVEVQDLVVGAVLEALGLVDVPFAVLVGIAGSGVGVTDVADLAAEAAVALEGGLGGPLAGGEGGALTGVDDLGALLCAGTAGRVPEAPVVVVARLLRGPAVEARAHADAVVVLDRAHVLGDAVGGELGLGQVGVFLEVEAGAGLGADLSLGVVHAIEVGVARGLGSAGVGEAALHAAGHRVGASGVAVGDEHLNLAAGVVGAVGVVVRRALAHALLVVGPPGAHVVRGALGRRGQHAAAGGADVGVGIPLALGVAVAQGLAQPAELALLGAGALVGLPDAHAAGGAVAFGFEEGAGLDALGGLGVPHAAVLGIAGGLAQVGVEDGAGSEAGGLVPGAEGVGLAELDAFLERNGGQVHVAAAVVAALGLLW